MSLTCQAKWACLNDQERGWVGRQRRGEIEDGKVEKCALLCTVDFWERSNQWVGDNCWYETMDNSA